MATLYSDIADDQNNALSNASKMQTNGALVTGNLRVYQAKYTTVGTEAANDVLYLARLNKGVYVIPSLSSIHSDGGLSGTFTANVGDWDEDGTVLDADRFISAANLASATNVLFSESATAVATIYKTVGPTWIGLQIATLATPAASGVITATITVACPT